MFRSSSTAATAAFAAATAGSVPTTTTNHSSSSSKNVTPGRCLHHSLNPGMHAGRLWCVVNLLHYSLCGFALIAMYRYVT